MFNRPRKLTGDLLFDGLGSFEHSQYHPYWLNIAVHGDSSFVVGFTDSPLRRSGTMTPKQRIRRAEIEAERGLPPRNAIRKGTADLLHGAMHFFRHLRTFLVSDAHSEYPRAIRDAKLTKLPRIVVLGSHPRTTVNPLFEINLADLLIRHGNSSQKRETIAFNKRRQAGLERAWLWLAWRNYMAPRHVKRRTPTPAVQAGVAPGRLTFADIFTKRRFGWQSPVPPMWQRQIRRDVATPAVGRNARHELEYAD